MLNTDMLNIDRLALKLSMLAANMETAAVGKINHDSASNKNHLSGF